ncbi:hypothetical protein PTZ02_16785 [Clostridium sp. 'White wine YQ']|nr:hypothetical protein [Clostridium sp. 'White wine YQ']
MEYKCIIELEEYIKTKVNEFYNECREKFTDHLDCRKLLLIKNEIHLDNNK